MPFQWTNQGGGWIDVASRLQDLSDAKQMAVLRDQAAIRQRLSDEQARRTADLRFKGDQYALRGQLLGTVETPEDYSRVMPILQSEGLPTQDLPEQSKSDAWLTFANKPEMTAAPAWLADKWRPAGGPSLPAPTDLPSESMQSPGIAPEEIATSVRRAAERGLPLDKQQAFRDKDLGRQIQLANLSRVQDKDALSREWMAFQRDAKIQGMSEAETQREFQRRLALMGYDIDIQKLGMQKESAAREAKKPTINEGQAKAVLFGQEVSASLRDFKNLLGKGFDPTSAKGSASITMAGAEGIAAPLRGFASQDAQIWNNAADQLAQAALRFESGAAIGEQEFGKKIRANIPRMGDSKEVVARKLQAIDRAARAFEEYSGKKFDQPGQATSAYKFTREYNGATYGRNSPTEPWKRVK